MCPPGGAVVGGRIPLQSPPETGTRDEDGLFSGDPLKQVVVEVRVPRSWVTGCSLRKPDGLDEKESTGESTPVTVGGTEVTGRTE